MNGNTDGLRIGNVKPTGASPLSSLKKEVSSLFGSSVSNTNSGNASNNNVRKLAGNAANGLNNLRNQVGASRQSHVENVVNQTLKPGASQLLERLKRNVG